MSTKLNKVYFLHHQRKQNYYKQEISYILHQIVQKYSLPSCSVNYCLLSMRGENLKIYLSFSQEENEKKLLKLLNNEYNFLIKKIIATSKKFSRIPTLKFLSDKDKKFLKVEDLEEIISKLDYKHNEGG